MDPNLPVTWLVGRITNALLSSAKAAASTIAGEITPLVAACFGIYVLLMSINYLRGAESEPVFDFFLKMASWAVLIGMGLSAGAYATNVLPIVTSIGADLANAISGGDSTAGAVDQMVVKLLTSIADESERVSLLKDGVMGYVTLAFVVVLILIGYVPLLVAAAIAIVIASSGLILVAAVGPIFFAFALFPATRQYFSAFSNTVVSLTLVVVFVSIVALTAMNIANEILTDMSIDTLFIGMVCNLVLMVLIRSVPGFASSLSAGGINMAMPQGGIGSVAAGIAKSFAKNKDASGKETGIGQAGLGRAGIRVASALGRAIAQKVNPNSIRKAG